MHRPSPSKWMQLLCGFLALASLASCRTTSQYVGDRALDFLDQYRVAGGVGTLAGVRVKAWGLYDTGLMVGVKPKATAIGWRYGAPMFFDARDSRLDANQAQLVTTTNAVGLDFETGSYVSAWNSIALLPGLLTWTDATPTDNDWEVPERGSNFRDVHWLWSPETFRNNRYAQIHAFDLEFEVGLGVYFDIGFSPGEFADFWLGLLTIDIAADDGRFKP